MPDLILPVKKEYFEAHKDGSKDYEFRLVKPYWITRLVDRKYNNVVITWGYPAANDNDRRLVFPYRGFEVQMRQHKEFGDKPVEVFAILTNKKEKLWTL